MHADRKVALEDRDRRLRSPGCVAPRRQALVRKLRRCFWPGYAAEKAASSLLPTSQLLPPVHARFVAVLLRSSLFLLRSVPAGARLPFAPAPVF